MVNFPLPVVVDVVTVFASESEMLYADDLVFTN